jgi:uncharacterized lipoprotein YddW (UPF0748 family)
MTTLEQVSGLYEIAEYMDDPELTQALEFVAKAILKPDIPPQVVVTELVRLQAIQMKLSLRATWLANVDKSDRAKKNLYYTAADSLQQLCQTLKYVVK